MCRCVHGCMRADKIAAHQLYQSVAVHTSICKYGCRAKRLNIIFSLFLIYLLTITGSDTSSLWCIHEPLPSHISCSELIRLKHSGLFPVISSLLLLFFGSAVNFRWIAIDDFWVLVSQIAARLRFSVCEFLFYESWRIWYSRFCVRNTRTNA